MWQAHWANNKQGKPVTLTIHPFIHQRTIQPTTPSRIQSQKNQIGGGWKGNGNGNGGTRKKLRENSQPSAQSTIFQPNNQRPIRPNYFFLSFFTVCLHSFLSHINAHPLTNVLPTTNTTAGLITNATLIGAIDSSCGSSRSTWGGNRTSFVT